MYKEYFHFSELPFSIAPDPHFMYMSTRHQEGLALLLYGINHGGGFVALTGEVGTGKTTLCHCLLQQLPKNIDIALILNPKVNAVELLATICDELGIKYDLHQQTLKLLVDTLNRYLLNAHANDRRTVLVIDEAQNLSLEVLEQIRLLTNLETSKIKLLQIILVGQPELQDILNRKELRQLNQRITARYHLLPLSMGETRTYIRHRLKVCKGDPDLFKEAAIKKIYQASKGVPRLINILCHCALLGAYSADSRHIDTAIVKRAIKETLAFKHSDQSYLNTLLTALGLGILLAVWFYWSQQAVNTVRTVQSRTILSGKFPVQPSLATPQPASLASTKLVPQDKSKSFRAWLDDTKLTLPAAMTQLLKLWGNPMPLGNQPIDCEKVQKSGLSCFAERGKWQDLVALDRPAILEFTVVPGLKKYVVLTGMKAGQPIFDFADNQSFPLADILSIWDGYYLMLWQSPTPGMKVLLPGQSSNQVLWLRQQLITLDSSYQERNWTLYYDEALKSRVIAFQKAHNLVADGKVGAQTVIHIDNLTGAKNTPRLMQMN